MNEHPFASSSSFDSFNNVDSGIEKENIHIDETDGINDNIFSNENTLSENTMVDTSIATLLGLLPPDNDFPKNPGSTPSKKRSVALKSLINYAFDHCSSSQNNSDESLFSFHDFVNWYYTPKYYDGAVLSLFQRRIGPILLDLRLVASIMFGIQPSLPSMENTLVSEVERRHKYRYPQTDNSKRGPMG
eukprot:CAMPEP_0197829692 /NCGR_PEP_ID=MMETSP1437-20131217/6231_1 /TAXON_ID=49252 ORGANISM="Eucampia antarctica, Strain CCMP1452" /NCGR_SAMPLE_ID=MMETSP1437 /ASSEMBLY_ACC=CAM_ASM_001096 /LENGTH=187 /DNA_ID=CAMNT_0043431585 /DNA_START=39 /DNA_END=598 /DNA_ORIENTATION=+